LNSEESQSLALKANTYLQCWQKAANVTDITTCGEEMEECMEQLKDYEVVD